MGFFSKLGAAISGTFSFVKNIFTSDVRNGTRDSPPNFSNSNYYTSQPTYNTGYSHYRDQYFTRDQFPCNHENIRPPRRSPVIQPVPVIEKPMTFLDMRQLDEYPIPKKVLAIECGDSTSQSTDEILK